MRLPPNRVPGRDRLETYEGVDAENPCDSRHRAAYHQKGSGRG